MTESLSAKTQAIFEELVKGRGERFDPSRNAGEIESAISSALAEDVDHVRAADIAFHLSDWIADGAFLVALQLFPERFTAEEIRGGVQGYLIHAPNHIAAAAHLAGWPIRDVFKVGLKLDD